MATPYTNVSDTTNLDELLLSHSMRNAGFLDFNGDGWGDLIVTFDDREGMCFKGSFNYGDPRFEYSEYSFIWGDERPSQYACGILFADFDNDGDLDFYTPNPTGHQLFEFDSTTQQYLDVTDEMGLNFTGANAIYRNTINAAWGDFDGDSYVDLLILQGTDDDDNPVGSDLQMLLHNDDGTGFSDSQLMNFGAGVGFQSIPQTMSALWADLDQDHDMDLVLVQGWRDNDFHTYSTYYKNDFCGQWPGRYFISAPDRIDDCLSDFAHFNNCASVADMNNDGLLDIVYVNRIYYGIYECNTYGSLASVWRSYDPTTNVPIIWDVALFDADLDGTNDMLVSQTNNDQQRPRLYYGCWENGEPRFDDRWPHSSPCGSQFFEPAQQDQRGLCTGSFVRDGQTEFFMTRTVDYVNQGEFMWDITDGPNNNWIGFDLAAPHGTCNGSVLGATVVLSHPLQGSSTYTQAKLVDGGSGRASQSDPSLVFGLGSFSGLVDVKALLPNKALNPAGKTIYLNQIPTGEYWTFDVDGLIDSSVSVSFSYQYQSELLAMTVEWSTYDNTDLASDQVTFYVDGIFGAIDPGQRIHVGGGSIAAQGDVYRHTMTIPDLPCVPFKKYYVSVQSGKAATKTYYASSIHSSSTISLCLRQAPLPQGN